MRDSLAATGPADSPVAKSSMSALTSLDAVPGRTSVRTSRKTSTLEECLVREYRAALEVFRSDDFREGVRAAVIDKDRNPLWSPPDIGGVTPEMLSPYFAEIGADELKFPTKT